jgi:hypothetical protein
METNTENTAAPSVDVPRLVRLAWQAVQGAKGRLYLDMHYEDAKPVIIAAIERAISWGLDEMKILRTAINAAFEDHAERMKGAIDDSVNQECHKAITAAGCKW